MKIPKALPISQNVNLIFRMMSIRCHVEDRPGYQFYNPLSIIQSVQKKYPETKHLLKHIIPLGTTATFNIILIFSKTWSSLYVLYYKSIYPSMRSLFIKSCSELKLILIYVKIITKKARCKIPLINPFVLKN